MMFSFPQRCRLFSLSVVGWMYLASSLAKRALGATCPSTLGESQSFNKFPSACCCF